MIFKLFSIFSLIVAGFLCVFVMFVVFILVPMLLDMYDDKQKGDDNRQKKQHFFHRKRIKYVRIMENNEEGRMI